jgi:hypothetical protein
MVSSSAKKTKITSVKVVNLANNIVFLFLLDRPEVHTLVILCTQMSLGQFLSQLLEDQLIFSLLKTILVDTEPFIS